MQLVCPARHDGTHMPVSHTNPAAQALPHIPQFARSLWRLVHAAGIPHAVWPAAHESSHAPMLQICPAAQALPHIPQFARSLCVFTH
jgi:hypothetical protein